MADIPAYLQPYCGVQDYESYTPRDHAAWRYIMRQARNFFKDHAVSEYIEGLAGTGIPTDRIPRIEEMDEALSRFGWGAVPIVGFIPPMAFLDLQARKILPIACDMRTVDHIGYTPAPDIVHEAAGHAPMLIDAGYREYLQRYATVANKAITSSEDIKVYEAIRYLSDVKENPDVSDAQVRAAQDELDAVAASVTYVSEVTRVTRMAWWTVEYGLAGDINRPRIYGAGLLSSVAESKACFGNSVKKVPFSIDCTQQGYDITKPQPQLYVCRSMQHLIDVLDELEDQLAFRRGGAYGLEEARKSAMVNSVVLNSGITVSGRLEAFQLEGDRPLSLALSGLVQMAVGEQEVARNDATVTTSLIPLGRFAGMPEKDPQHVTDDELRRMGIVVGEKASLPFVTGAAVSGRVTGIRRDAGVLTLISWQQGELHSQGEKQTFSGDETFHLPIGEVAVSVYGGPADRAAFGDMSIGQASSTPGRQSPYTAVEKSLFGCYAELRSLRARTSEQIVAPLLNITKSLTQQHPNEWLAMLEALEIGESLDEQSPELAAHLQGLRDRLKLLQAPDLEKGRLIRDGLELAQICD